ncbi:alpha/beta fold hydrolase [Pseudolysinimonas sp.]|jgi:pimeloyl-ACP methyl ester carboxylesterase|uniref:alpha/beta fold hydrolase n=1 Tax=Pseudolysinimonas sp. TaxID=2680009 RepID=UPI0037833A71
MGWLRSLLRRPPLLHVAGDAGDGPPVVLLHGIASSSVTFEFVVPLITSRHRAVSIDLLGFGASPAPDDAGFTIEEHVAALHRTLRKLGLKRFVLVGHSMGALIATRYAATYRTRVTRLVIVSPPVYLTPSEIGPAFDRAAMGGYFRVYEFLRANKDFTIRAAAGLARLSPIKNLLDVTETNWRAFVLSLEKSIESQTTVSDLVSVQAPIHLVYGALDPLLHPAGLRIVENLRNVTTHRVQGVDHVIRPRMARVVATAVG